MYFLNIFFVEYGNYNQNTKFHIIVCRPKQSLTTQTIADDCTLLYPWFSDSGNLLEEDSGTSLEGRLYIVFLLLLFLC
jgi:hypothetical protein